jgi:lambda family phage portal protein
MNPFSPEASVRRAQAKFEIEKIQARREVLQMQRSLLHQGMNPKNSGYDQSGASTRKNSLRGWTPYSKSPQEDIDANLDVLRQRSRDLVMSAPLAASAVSTKATNAIGSGLVLKSIPDFEVLGMTREQAEAIGKDIERRFNLWASSKLCDATRVNDFYGQQKLAYRSWKTNGDVFALIKYRNRMAMFPYSLRLHLIEADRVCTPSLASFLSGWFSSGARNIVAKNTNNGNYIYNGVEVDSDGAVVAYYVCSSYPNSTLTGMTKKWERIEAWGAKTGNPNIIHIMESERCEQYRGVPMLAPVIETLKQISRLTEAELQAAVIQAFYTVFIKVEGDKSENPFPNIIPGSEQLSKDEEEEDISYELGMGAVNVLGKGEEPVFADPKRPNSGFEPFMSAMAKVLGAAIGVPYELLMKSFTSSYSASRAALLEAWKGFKIDRTEFAADFNQPIYELWLAEDIALGNMAAPGFFTSPMIRAAWCKALWIGPTQGQIDPVKEVSAAILRVRHAFSTHEREAQELNGSNYDDNIEIVTLENEKLRAANPVDYPLPTDTPTDGNDQGGQNNA